MTMAGDFNSTIGPRGAASLTASRTASICINAHPATRCALSTPTTSVWRAAEGS